MSEAEKWVIVAIAVSVVGCFVWLLSSRRSEERPKVESWKWRR